MYRAYILTIPDYHCVGCSCRITLMYCYVQSVQSSMVDDCISNYKLLFYVFFILAEKVTFIDFEYAAYNYQAYDIAMHFCDYAGDDYCAIILYI